MTNTPATPGTAPSVGERASAAISDMRATAVEAIDNAKAKFNVGDTLDSLDAEFQAAPDSTTPEVLVEAVVTKGSTQHLTENPPQGLAKSPVEVQKAIFEANLRPDGTREAGAILEQAADKIAQSAKETYRTYHIPEAVLSIPYIEVIDANAVRSETSIRVEDIISPRAEQRKNALSAALGTEAKTSTARQVVENTKKISDRIFGSGVTVQISNMAEESIVDAEGGDSEFVLAVQDYYTKTLAEFGIDDEYASPEGISELLKVAILKTMLLSEGTTPQEIRRQLFDSARNAAGFKLPTNIQNEFDKLLILQITDAVSSRNPEFFDDGTKGPKVVASNREILQNALRQNAINGSEQEITLTNTTSGVGELFKKLADKGVENLEWETLNDTRVATPARANARFNAIRPNASGEITYDARIYQGLAESIPVGANELANILLQLELAASYPATATFDPRGLLHDFYRTALLRFKDDNYTGDNSDTDLTNISRMSALLLYRKSLETVVAQTPPAINEFVKSILQDEVIKRIEMATPEGMMQSLQSDLLFQIESAVSTGPNYFSLRTLEFPLTQLQIERLATAATTIEDVDYSAVTFARIRSLTMLSALTELAEQQAGSKDDPKYAQYLIAIISKVGFLDGADSSEFVQQFTQLMFEQQQAGAALSLPISSDPTLNRYLTFLQGSDAEIAEKFEVGGLKSAGPVYKLVHSQFGAIRRAEELVFLKEVVTRDMDEAARLAAVKAHFKIEDDTQAQEALARLKTVIGVENGGVLQDGTLTLEDIQQAAIFGTNTPRGERFTNMFRYMRHFVVNGGSVEGHELHAQRLSFDQYFANLQIQANPDLGVKRADVLLADKSGRNRVLGLEAQRNAAFEKFEELNNKKGWDKFFTAIKETGSKVIKTLPYMILAGVAASGGAVVAPLAAGILLVSRVAGIATTLWQGIPLVKSAFANKNYKAGLAAVGALALNVAVYSFAPPGLATTFGLIFAETVGNSLTRGELLKRDAKRVVEAFSTYDTAVENLFESVDITEPGGKKLMLDIARSLNVEVEYDEVETDDDGNDLIDKATTLAKIVAARTAAREENNLALLEPYGALIEQHIQEASTQTREKLLLAKKIHDDNNQALTAYMLASGSTKIFMAGLAGAKTGYEADGVWGGVKGAFGIGPDTSPEALLDRQSEALDTHLEANVEDRMTELGISTKDSDDLVTGIIETTNPDGTVTHFAALDLNGDQQIDALVPVNELNLADPSQSSLNWSNVQLPTDDSGNIAWADDPYVLKAQVSTLSNTPMSQISIEDVTNDGSGVLKHVNIGEKEFVFVREQDGQINLYSADQVKEVAVDRPAVDSSPSSDSTGSPEYTGNQTERPEYGEAVYTAQPGDSQWSMIAGAIIKNNPDLDPWEVNNATANIIDEAGAGKIYSAVYENRTIEVNGEDVPKLGMRMGGAIQPGDELSFDDILKIAPRTGASVMAANGTVIEGGADVVGGSMGNGGAPITTPEASDTVGLDIKGSPFEVGARLTPSGVLVLTSEAPEGGNVIGTMTIGGQSYSGAAPVADDSATASDDNATDDNRNPLERFKDWIGNLGGNKEEAPTETKETAQPANSSFENSTLGGRGGAVATPATADDNSPAAAQPAVDQPQGGASINDFAPGTTEEGMPASESAQTGAAATGNGGSATPNDDGAVASDQPVDAKELQAKLDEQTDTFTVRLPFGGSMDLFENNVKEIIVTDKFGSRVSFDPKDFDIESISPDREIILLTPDGKSLEPIDLSGKTVSVLIEGQTQPIDLSRPSALEALEAATKAFNESSEQQNGSIQNIVDNIAGSAKNLTSGSTILTEGFSDIGDSSRDLVAQARALGDTVIEEATDLGRSISTDAPVYNVDQFGGEDWEIDKDPVFEPNITQQLNQQFNLGKDVYSQIQAYSLGKGNEAIALIDINRIAEVTPNSITFINENGVLTTISNPGLEVVGIGDIFTQDGSFNTPAVFTYTGQPNTNANNIDIFTDPTKAWWNNQDFVGTKAPVLIKTGK